MIHGVYESLSKVFDGCLDFLGVPPFPGRRYDKPLVAKVSNFFSYSAMDFAEVRRERAPFALPFLGARKEILSQHVVRTGLIWKEKMNQSTGVNCQAVN